MDLPAVFLVLPEGNLILSAVFSDLPAVFFKLPAVFLEKQALGGGRNEAKINGTG